MTSSRNIRETFRGKYGFLWCFAAGEKVGAKRPNPAKVLVLEAGIEPARLLRPQDFKSCGVVGVNCCVCKRCACAFQNLRNQRETYQHN